MHQIAHITPAAKNEH